jgi:hypothetical protein
MDFAETISSSAAWDGKAREIKSEHVLVKCGVIGAFLKA